MRLASHLVIPKSNDIKDWAVGCEESVEGEAEVRLSNFLGEIGQIESMII